MCLFKKRKRFAIMQVSTGTYYAGLPWDDDDRWRMWTRDKDLARLFDQASADRVHVAMINARIGGNLSFGTTAVVEL